MKKKDTIIKKLIKAVFSILLIVITFPIMLFSLLGILATMPSQEKLTMSNDPNIDTIVKGYLEKAAENNNPQLMDYYGNDKAYLNKWSIIQSIMLTYSLAQNIKYDDSNETKQKIDQVAYDIRPILSYKTSKRITIHEYYEETKKGKRKLVKKRTEEEVKLLTEADSILIHHQYEYKETQETVSDGSDDGTYTYIYEEVSGINEVGDDKERLKKYIKNSIGIEKEELIEENADFIVNTNYSYENSIENAYLTGDGDYEYGFYVPERDVYKNIPEVDANNLRREDIVKIAKSLLTIIDGKDPLPYFWGGKYPKKGINESWGSPRPITASGNSNWPVGTPLPLGLDCSGFVDWVYMQAIDKLISDLGGGGGAAAQFYACKPIKETELKPGDLGFQNNPYKTGGSANHVGIFIGRDIDGIPLFIHCGGTIYKIPGDSFYKAGRVVISRTKGKYGDNPPVLFRYFGRPPVKFQGE